VSFAPFADADYELTTWFERDRQHVMLTTPRGREVFSLWDEDVTQAVEDGFLPTPINLASALSYARSQGLIK